MYKYTFNSDVTNDVASQMDGLKDIFAKYKEIDSKYSVDSKPLDLEKLKFEDMTDDEISKKASIQLEEYKKNGVEDIERNYHNGVSKVDENIVNAQKNATDQKTEAVSLHSALKDSAAKDSLKRGLGRSSIVINVMEAFDKSLIDEYSKINEELTTNISKLNSQKDVLESQKNNALSSFDLNYAIKLQDKIDAINEDLDKKEQEIIEYNNEIEEKEREWQKDQAKDTRDFVKFQKENEVEFAASKYKEKYEITRDYLMSMPREDAFAIVNNNRYILEQVGPKNLVKLEELFR